MQQFLAWLVTFLIALRPSGHIHDHGCRESEADYAARISAHVDAAASVVFDTDEPSRRIGPWALERSLIDVLAIAHHESQGFCRAVDTGERRADSGKTVCAMGVMTDGGYAGGYALKHLLDERRVCYLVGYRRMRKSWPMCWGWPDSQLRVYASGQCDRGGRESHDMLAAGTRWWGKAFQAWQRGEW